MKETASKAFDRTVNTPEGDLDGSFNNILDPVNGSANSVDTVLYYIDKKAKMAHDQIPSFEAFSDDANSADSDTVSDSIDSHVLEATKILQLSQSGMCPEVSSTGRQTTIASRGSSAETVRGIPGYGTPNDDTLSPRPSEMHHAKFRRASPDLMTLHRFTGVMNGQKPVYVPVYKRNSFGRLLKLVKDWEGRWKYIKLETLTDDEVEEGLKILVKPKAEVVLQSSEPKKVVGRRTLADFGLPETNSKGGWGWL